MLISGRYIGTAWPDLANCVTHPIPASQPPDLTIRPMKLEDVPRVHEIDVISFTMPWPEKSFQFELKENPTTLALVAEVIDLYGKPLIIGMAVVWIVLDEAHIATISIHPDFRGHGFGKRLLGESLRQAIRRGARLATLEVREHNLLAQQMYLKFSFKIAGRRLRYYKDNNEDAVIMTVDSLGVAYLDQLDRLGV